MLNKFLIGRYYPINSLVHKMNSISKIICILLFIILSLLTYNLKFNLLLFIILILMLLNTKVNLKIYFNAILSLKWFLLLIFLINLIFGFKISILIIFKLISIILYTSILTITTPPTEITYGIEKLLTPFKLIGLPVNKIALFITNCLRFIPTLIDKKNIIMKSQASRGIDYYNSDLKGKILSIKSLIKPVINITLYSLNNISSSMEIRLYNIYNKRVNFRQNKWGFYDTFLVLLHLMLLALYIKEVVL